MVPGFVTLGALAVLLQLLVVGGYYAVRRSRRPVADPDARRRVGFVLGAGAALAALGQLAALGAVGSLRVAPLLSLEQATSVANAGALVALVGYGVVLAAFVLHGRAGDAEG